MAVSLENEVVEQPWFDDWGPVHQQKIVQTMIRNESDALLDYPKNYEGVYAIVNEEKLNRWGYRKFNVYLMIFFNRKFSSWLCHPPENFPSPFGRSLNAILASSITLSQTNLDSKRTRNNVNFAKHHLAVSRRKDSEPSSSSMWNLNLPGAPRGYWFFQRRTVV